MSSDSGRWALVDLSGALASRDPTGLVTAMDRAAEVARWDEVEEIILQSYLFLGYPAALNGFGLWRQRSGAEPPRASDERVSWHDRGEEVARVVYGDQFDALRANVRRLHPDMERWMVDEGYGKVLGRPGPSLATRELCIVALLAVLDAPRQLYSHLRGARSAGASAAEVERALGIAAERATPAARIVADETWASMSARSAEGG